MVILYRARHVCPVSTAPIKDGMVAVEDGRILAVGPVAVLSAHYGGERVEDLSESVLMPGAINAHTHLELTSMADAVPHGLPFTEWITALVRERRKREASESAHAAAHGIALSRAAGTVAVGEISTRGESVRPLVESGMRGVIYFELLNADPAKAADELRRGQEQLAQWRREYPGARIRFGLSLHAPYTVSAPLFRMASAWCLRERVPLSIHAAESPAETQWLLDHTGPIADLLYRPLGLPLDLEPAPGCSPIAYLERLGVLEARPLLAHAVQVDAADLARLAERHVPVAHCPRSNTRLLCGRMPYGAYRQAGVPLALGTDSLASSPSLSIWEEGTYAETLHCAAGEEPSPHELLRSATLEGARALGVDVELGSLEIGKSAEMAWAPLQGLDERERADSHHVLKALFSNRLRPRLLRD